MKADKYCASCGRGHSLSATYCSQCGDALRMPPLNAHAQLNVKQQPPFAVSRKARHALAGLVILGIFFAGAIVALLLPQNHSTTESGALARPSGRAPSNPENNTSETAATNAESHEEINGYTVTVVNRIPEEHRREVCYWITQQQDPKPGNAQWSELELSTAAAHFELTDREVRSIVGECVAKHWPLPPRPTNSRN